MVQRVCEGLRVAEVVGIMIVRFLIGFRLSHFASSRLDHFFLTFWFCLRCGGLSFGFSRFWFGFGYLGFGGLGNRLLDDFFGLAFGGGR